MLGRFRVERLKTSFSLSHTHTPSTDWSLLLFSLGGKGLHSLARGINQEYSCEISETAGDDLFFSLMALIWDKCTVRSFLPCLMLLK